MGSPPEFPEKLPTLPRPSTPDFPLGLPPSQPGAPGLSSDRHSGGGGVGSDIAEAVARTRLRLAVVKSGSTSSSSSFSM